MFSIFILVVNFVYSISVKALDYFSFPYINNLDALIYLSHSLLFCRCLMNHYGLCSTTHNRSSLQSVLAFKNNLLWYVLYIFFIYLLAYMITTKHYWIILKLFLIMRLNCNIQIKQVYYLRERIFIFCYDSNNKK